MFVLLLRALKRFGKLVYRVKMCERYNMTVPELFQQTVAKHPNKTAIMFEDQRWTYRQVSTMSVLVEQGHN